MSKAERYKEINRMSWNRKVAIHMESDFYDMMAVYDGDCGSLTCHVHNRANMPAPKHLAWFSDLNTKYKLYVAGFEDIVGNFYLTAKVSRKFTSHAAY